MKTRALISYVVFSLLFFSSLIAQADVIIHAGRVFADDGVYLKDQGIVVSDSKIVDVLPWKQVRVRSEDEVIDLSDKTVLPGLIDAHTHLLDNRTGDTSYVEELTSKSIPYRTLEGAKSAEHTLLAGFTSVRDVETEGAGYADVMIRNAINNGLYVGPHIQAATRGIVAYGSYYPRNISYEYIAELSGAQQVSGVEEARKAVREQLHGGADVIKVYADFPYVVGDLHPTLSPEELKVIVEETHRAKRKVAAHATSPEGIENAILAGADSIEHGTNASAENLKMMAKEGVYLVPTTNSLFPDELPTDPVALATLETKQSNARRILKEARDFGVSIANGSDSAGFDFHGKNAVELTSMVKLGLSNLEAIQAATTTAAKLMGVYSKTGSLEPEKLADIIAVDGDPLKDITVLESVIFVMKAGKVYKKP